MKFKQYLNENKLYDIKELSHLIKTQCKPYLKLIKGKTPLYRGISDLIGDDYFYGNKKTRSDRRPLGTPQKEFDYINLWLQINNHNTRNKSVVICTSNKKNTETFGNAYMIFPTGNISYTWIDSKDFNFSDSKTGWNFQFIYNFLSTTNFQFTTFEDNISIEEYNKSVNMKKPFGEYFHTDKGFNIAYKNGYEFWIKCKSYYYINSDVYKWDSKQGIEEL